MHGQAAKQANLRLASCSFILWLPINTSLWHKQLSSLKVSSQGERETLAVGWRDGRVPQRACWQASSSVKWVIYFLYSSFLVSRKQTRLFFFLMSQLKNPHLYLFHCAAQATSFPWIQGTNRRGNWEQDCYTRWLYLESVDNILCFIWQFNPFAGKYIPVCLTKWKVFDCETHTCSPH